MSKMVSAKAVDGPLMGDVLYIPEDGKWVHVQPTSATSAKGAASFEVWTYIPKKLNDWLWVAVATHKDCYEIRYLEPVLERTEVLNHTRLLNNGRLTINTA